MTNTRKTVTREQMMATIGTDTAFWSATCAADADEGEEDGNLHTMAWDWLRGGTTEEGVEIVRGSVRVTSPDGIRYHVTA